MSASELLAHPDAGPVLSALLARLRDVFGPRLVGAYVYGSLTAGDYDCGVSEVDVLCLTASPITDTDLDALAAMHELLAGAHPAFIDRIEVIYADRAGVVGFRQAPAAGAVISLGHGLKRTAMGCEWLSNWYLAATTGVAVHGPPAATVLPAVTDEEFLGRIRAHLAGWPRLAREAQRTRSLGYAVLTVCRGWCTVMTGRRVSKRQAALAAKAAFPHFGALIDDAFAWRAASPAQVPDPETTRGRVVELVDELVADALCTWRTSAPDAGPTRRGTHIAVGTDGTRRKRGRLLVADPAVSGAASHVTAWRRNQARATSGRTRASRPWRKPAGERTARSRLSDSGSWRCPRTDFSAGPSPSPRVEVFLGCVIAAFSWRQVGMNARREPL